MIIAIQGYNAHKYTHLLEQMFRLRARVFYDRLRWDVQVVDGMEKDEYDDEGPVYLVYTDQEARTVKGSLRLLPTTGPTVLADFFSDTRPQLLPISAPTIWECTRFCLDNRLLNRIDRNDVIFTSSVMIIALGQLAIRSGIESIIANFDRRCFDYTNRSAAKSMCSAQLTDTAMKSCSDRFPFQVLL